jgi:hypothetical protein
MSDISALPIKVLNVPVITKSTGDVKKRLLGVALLCPAQQRGNHHLSRRDEVPWPYESVQIKNSMVVSGLAALK